MSDFIKNGGAWLGATRSWIQWNCINGSDVTWGSSEILRCKRNFTPALVEEIAATAVDAAFPEVDKLKDEIEELRRKLLKAQMGISPALSQRTPLGSAIPNDRHLHQYRGHQEDGPVVEYIDGDKHWYIHDKKLTKQEFNQRNQSCDGKIVVIDGKEYKLKEQ